MQATPPYPPTHPPTHHMVCPTTRMALITTNFECTALTDEHDMALITSDCGKMRSLEHQMALITSDCS